MQPNDSTARIISRRELLSVVGTSAIVPRVSSAETESLEEIGDVNLLEARIVVKEDFDSPCHIPLPDYTVDVGTSTITLFDPDKETENIIETSETVIEVNGFQSAPDTVFKGKSRADPPSRLSETMDRIGIMPTVGSMPLPPARVSDSGSDSVKISVSNIKRRIGDREKVGIETKPAEVNIPSKSSSDKPENRTVTPMVVVRYLTRMSVEKYVPG